MTLDEYAGYSRAACDDDPLYLFDPHLPQELLQTVPIIAVRVPIIAVRVPIIAVRVPIIAVRVLITTGSAAGDLRWAPVGRV
jgi:hypothetical protein